MNGKLFLLEFSRELRAWVHTLMPAILAFFSGGLAGWHMPQPGWMKKKETHE
jgi:hypothetical protein